MMGLHLDVRRGGLVTVRGFVGRNEESSTNDGDSTHRAPCCGTTKDAVIAPKRLITAYQQPQNPGRSLRGPFQKYRRGMIWLHPPRESCQWQVRRFAGGAAPRGRLDPPAKHGRVKIG